MKIKMAMVLETGGGGAGRHVLDLAQGLSDRGWDVTLFYSKIRASESFIDSLSEMKEVTLVPVDMFRNVGIRDLLSLQKLISAFKSAGPFDLTHAHSSKAGALTRILPSALTGRRIYTPHCFITMDPELGQLKRIFFGLAERLLAGRGEYVIAVSQRELEHALALGIPRTKIVKVTNGTHTQMQLDRQAARQRLGIAPGELAFGFIGRLDTQKNPELFVGAIEKAHKRDPRIKGIVFGDGPSRRALEMQSDQSACHFMGWLNASRYATGLDLLLLTSRYEAMPYILIEALQSGLPIIATDVGGVEETVADGVNGLKMKRSITTNALASLIGDIATRPETIKRWGQASASMASQFSATSMVDRTASLYKDVLSR